MGLPLDTAGKRNVRRGYPSLVQRRDPLLTELVNLYNALEVSERKDVSIVQVDCSVLNTDLDGCLYTAGKNVRNGPVDVTSDNLGIDGVRAIDKMPKYKGILKELVGAAKERRDWPQMIKTIVGIVGV